MTDARSIKYGESQNKLCTEFCLNSNRRPVLFLWLPLVFNLIGTRNGKVIGRTRTWTDWQKASVVAHVPRELGRIDRTIIEISMGCAEHSINELGDIIYSFRKVASSALKVRI